MNASKHPLAAKNPRLQKVATVAVTVTDPNDINKVAHKVHAFVRTIDRHGIVIININGAEFKPEEAKPVKPAKPAKKSVEESLLD
jgi:hypothetical protein